MPDTSIKIYRVQSLLNKDGFNTKVKEWGSCIEKQKVYIVTIKMDRYETIVRHIKKENIGIVKSGFWDHITSIGFSCLCFHDDIFKKERECEAAVLKTLKRRKEELDSLLKHIQL